MKHNIKEIVERFDERWEQFEIELSRVGNKNGWIMKRLYPILNDDHNKVKSFLIQSHIDMLDDLLEEMNKQISTDFTDVSEDNIECLKSFNYGVETSITHLQKRKEELKELNIKEEQ